MLEHDKFDKEWEISRHYNMCYQTHMESCEGGERERERDRERLCAVSMQVTIYVWVWIGVHVGCWCFRYVLVVHT